jgi:hypothetical protein
MLLSARTTAGVFSSQPKRAGVTLAIALRQAAPHSRPLRRASECQVAPSSRCMRANAVAAMEGVPAVSCLHAADAHLVATIHLWHRELG